MIDLVNITLTDHNSNGLHQCHLQSMAASCSSYSSSCSSWSPIRLKYSFNWKIAHNTNLIHPPPPFSLSTFFEIYNFYIFTLRDPPSPLPPYHLSTFFRYFFLHLLMIFEDIGFCWTWLIIILRWFRAAANAMNKQKGCLSYPGFGLVVIVKSHRLCYRNTSSYEVKV